MWRKQNYFEITRSQPWLNPESFRHQVISNHDIDHAEWVCPCIPRGRISNTSHFIMFRDYMIYWHIFLKPIQHDRDSNIILVVVYLFLLWNIRSSYICFLWPCYCAMNCLATACFIKSNLSAMQDDSSSCLSLKHHRGRWKLLIQQWQPSRRMRRVQFYWMARYSWLCLSRRTI